MKETRIPSLDSERKVPLIDYSDNWESSPWSHQQGLVLDNATTWPRIYPALFDKIAYSLCLIHRLPVWPGQLWRRTRVSSKDPCPWWHVWWSPQILIRSLISGFIHCITSFSRSLSRSLQVMSSESQIEVYGSFVPFQRILRTFLLNTPSPPAYQTPRIHEVLKLLLIMSREYSCLLYTSDAADE